MCHPQRAYLHPTASGRIPCRSSCRPVEGGDSSDRSASHAARETQLLSGRRLLSRRRFRLLRRRGCASDCGSRRSLSLAAVTPRPTSPAPVSSPSCSPAPQSSGLAQQVNLAQSRPPHGQAARTRRRAMRLRARCRTAKSRAALVWRGPARRETLVVQSAAAPAAGAPLMSRTTSNQREMTSSMQGVHVLYCTYRSATRAPPRAYIRIMD